MVEPEGRKELGRSLLAALAEVPDPRSAWGIRHPLAVIMALTVCAMLGGARSRTPLPNGAGSIPSWPGCWDSAGSRPPARRRCPTCSGGGRL